MKKVENWFTIPMYRWYNLEEFNDTDADRQRLVSAKVMRVPTGHIIRFPAGNHVVIPNEIGVYTEPQ